MQRTLRCFKNRLIAFQNNVNVTDLEIQDNWLEGEGGEYISEMLKENCYIASLVRCWVLPIDA